VAIKIKPEDLERQKERASTCTLIIYSDEAHIVVSLSKAYN
jgi:hypothetical protein